MRFARFRGFGFGTSHEKSERQEPAMSPHKQTERHSRKHKTALRPRSTQQTARYPSEDDVEPEESARMRRHPLALDEDESLPLDRPRPVDAEGHPPPAVPTSGTLASVDDPDDLPVVDSGLARVP